MRFVSSIIALGFATGAHTLATPAQAQRATPSPEASEWAIDGSLGLAIPVGNYGKGLNTGLDLMGALEFNPNPGGIYWRGELGYTHFGLSNADGHSNQIRLAADGLYDLPVSGTPLQPYVLGGVGIHHVTVQACVGGVCAGDNSTGFGINFGGGVRYAFASRTQVFFEARYVIPFTAPGTGISSAPYFPFQFGLRFKLPE